MLLLLLRLLWLLRLLLLLLLQALLALLLLELMLELATRGRCTCLPVDGAMCDMAGCVVQDAHLGLLYRRAAQQLRRHLDLRHLHLRRWRLEGWRRRRWWRRRPALCLRSCQPGLRRWAVGVEKVAGCRRTVVFRMRSSVRCAQTAEIVLIT